jgi:hypothetical protein
MKLTTGILAVGMMTGGLWAQNPNIINNVRNTMNGVQQQRINDSNAALGISGTPASAQAANPGAGGPAKAAAIRPAGAPQKGAPARVAIAAKPHAAPVAKKPGAPHPVIVAKEDAFRPAAKTAVPTTKIAADAKTAAASNGGDAAKPPKPEDKKWAMTGKRDPFFSPVVQQPSGSGCSTGKKCLEIGQINLRGVVKAESGFIAVVTNSLNKAYFLHENDPVFNGYVMRITGDSVVFQETGQDKLGKPLTREVVKRITTPAV